MKNIIKLSILTTSLLLMVGCSKEYLETKPTEFISEEDFIDAAVNNPDLVVGTLSGIYATMVATGTGGSTDVNPDNLRHDDFGQKGYDIMTDMLSSDMVLASSTYGWYKGVTEYQPTQDYTMIENSEPWRYYYRLIRSCNEVINTLGGNDIIPEDDEKRWVMGQTKAIRAHSYFYLTQLYADKYDPAAEILPIYVTSVGEESLAQPKSTTQEVYNLIVSDLTEAISLLDDFNRSAKNEINVPVAKGILSYVYGVMGKDAEVKTLTNDIITTGGFTLMDADEVLGGFNKLKTSGWMWGQEITSDLGLDLVSWWGQMDLFTYSYAWAGDPKTMDKGLYDAIPANDVRKGQFNSDVNDDYYLAPLNKFYHPERIEGGQRTVITPYLYMRVAEMYLLNAEASARTGDEPGARTRLGELLVERGVDPSYLNGLSGTALLNEIYLQTRIELWGEGKSYLALKRFKGTTTRGSNHLSNVGQTLNYDDNKLTFEIPILEIQNNPYINSQN